LASGPSVVTGHGRSWEKIRTKPKGAACGCKAESPARFDTVFVWDKGHQLGDFFGPDGEYPASLMQQACADKPFQQSVSLKSMSSSSFQSTLVFTRIH